MKLTSVNLSLKCGAILIACFLSLSLIGGAAKTHTALALTVKPQETNAQEVWSAPHSPNLEPLIVRSVPPACSRREKHNPAETACVLKAKYEKVNAPEETVKVVTANIKNGMAPHLFQADYSKVLEAKPDFIMLQEVAYRSNEELAVDGYAIHRSMDSPYLRETPVLWAADRWTALSTGSRWLTTRKVKWGERAVNWATLKSKTTGRIVTIISAHPAPTIKATQGLLPIFTANLAKLIHELGPEAGEILVAGDFNAHYGGKLWHEAGFTDKGLISTFDTFGSMPTGDHYGATIDYMFGRSSSTLAPTAQGSWEQASDHKALWSTWKLSEEKIVERWRLKTQDK